MSHRAHSTKHSLPNNPIFIEFPRSDGSSTTWPSNTTEIVDAEGNVNFMHFVELSESLAIKWRASVGDAIALHFNYPDHESHRHVLRQFPDGYRMFDHHKGKQAAPRHDVYLFGCGYRFRSVPEFIPHAIWLMGDEKEACKCKYCSKKPQREISKAMSDIMRSASQSPGPSPSRPPRPKHPLPSRTRLPDPRREIPKATMQKAVPDVSPYIQTNVVMLTQRSHDIRAVTRIASQESVIPRYFREDELVWYALDPPIKGPRDLKITFWPGTIEKYHLGRIPMTQGRESPPEFHVYAVQLLATSRTCVANDTRVLPYQSYIVHDDLFVEMMRRTPQQWQDLFEPALANFDPFPESSASPPSWHAVLTSFAVALQTASNVTDHWSVTDDWDAKIQVPQQIPHGSISSLTSAIERAGANNTRPLKALSQTRFQGLWWGGERIWVDDLVRLKLPRSCVAPEGSQFILAPSGTDPTIADEHDVSLRSVFLRIDSLFVLEGKPRQVRAAGMLYELADENWRDPDKPHLPEGVSPTQQPPAVPGDASRKPMPLPPKGLLFRPIVKPGHEVAVCLSLVAGRYYPRILQHPLLLPQILRSPFEDHKAMRKLSHIWSLEGIFPGVDNSVDPRTFKANRESVLRDAFKTARRTIEQHANEAQDDNIVPMEVE